METVKIIANYTPDTSIIQTIVRLLMGTFLMYAGIGHLSFSRQEFQAQVPPWVPLDADLVVVISGVAEMILGALLLFIPRYKSLTGWLVAIFLVIIFPGNISQYTNQVDGFGLDTDQVRLGRLFFQPIFIIVALWSTGAWGSLEE